MWRRTAALVIKEFLALLKDRRSRRLIIIPPLVQLFVFSYAATFEVRHAATAVLNEDGGAASRDLIARFESSPGFAMQAPLQAEAEIDEAISSKRAAVVLHFPKDFTSRVLRGREAPFQVILDGRDSNSAAVLLGYVREIVKTYNSGLATIPRYAGFDVRVWYNPNLESRWFIVPAIAGLLTLVVTLMVTALSVAREREAGTFDQLLVTPLRPFEILIGKSLPAFVIGFFEVTVVLLVAVFWFGVPFTGSIAGLYLGIFLFLLSTIGIGLMISAVSGTQQQALLGAFLFVAPAVILSGFATPIANMPAWIQSLTRFNPLRYILVILRAQFLEGASFAVLWPQYWPMALIGVACMAAAAWLFRHRLG